MKPRTWRLAHRWLGSVAAVFLLFAGATGVLVAGSEFFGEAEAERERLRDVVSPVLSNAPIASWIEPLQRVLPALATKAPAAPVDAIEWRLKGDRPTLVVRTGLPQGGEDRRFVFDAKTGALLAEEPYADKPFLYRLHSGEAFGDGGLVMAMGWGLALVLLTCSGAVIYWQMRRPGATGWKRLFW